MQQLYTVLKAAWGGEESSSLMENGFSSLQAGNAFRTARQLLEQQEKEAVVPVDVESLQADVNAGRFLTAQPEAAQLPAPLGRGDRQAAQNRHPAPDSPGQERIHRPAGARGDR